MEHLLKIDGRVSSIFFVEPRETSLILIFLHGGGKTLGKSRFIDWQNSLSNKGIGSVSFDFFGVGGSYGNLSEETLQKRIQQAEYVTKWIKRKYPASSLVVYGVSMGGYVALGLANKLQNLFKGIILHAPAAYSTKAHGLIFDSSFTSELHKVNGWETSKSFKWLDDFSNPILLITAEKEKVIPEKIIDSYIEIIQSKPMSKHLIIPKAEHNIWTDSLINIESRNIVYSGLIDFVSFISARGALF